MSDNFFFVAIGLVGAAIFGWLLHRGFQTGRMWVKNDYSASRSNEPFFFWSTAAMNVAMILLGAWLTLIGLWRLLAT